jgi:hypothetical protein
MCILLKHYATNRKVVGLILNEVTGFFNWPNTSSHTTALGSTQPGLILNEVTGFFNWPNTSSHTTALGSTQPLTEMSTRNLPAGKGQLVCKADNFIAICELIF